MFSSKRIVRLSVVNLFRSIRKIPCCCTRFISNVATTAKLGTVSSDRGAGPADGASVGRAAAAWDPGVVRGVALHDPAGPVGLGAAVAAPGAAAVVVPGPAAGVDVGVGVAAVAVASGAS